MFFKKNNKKSEIQEQTKFTSNDGRITYDRDYLMYVIRPTDEELEIFAKFSNQDIKIPSENTTGQDDELFERVLSKTLYDLFLLCDSKHFNLYSRDIKVDAENGVDNTPCIICSFFIGACYDCITKTASFIVNPLYYHEGNIDLEGDMEVDDTENPEITIFKELYAEFVAYAKKANDE